MSTSLGFDHITQLEETPPSDDALEFSNKTIKKRINNLASWCAQNFTQIKRAIGNTGRAVQLQGKKLLDLEGRLKALEESDE